MNRTYESMITTLHKYPWHTPQHVSFRERKLIFDTTLTCFRWLIAFIRRGKDQALTPILLQELAVAALTCPGFSEQQKSTIVSTMQQGGFGGMAAGSGIGVRFGGNSRLSSVLPFQVLAFKAGVSEEVIEVSHCCHQYIE